MELLRAREKVMERFRPILSEHGLTEQQWRVLRILNETEGLDATKLAEQSNVLMPSLTRIIKLLETRGMIETRRDAHDGRRALASLTVFGRRTIQEITPHSIAAYGEIERLYGAERMAKLLDELQALTDCLED